MEINQKDEKRVVSLERTRKNSRKKVDKKSGRKKPRTMDVDADVEVIPAPDSKFSISKPRYREALGVEDLVTEAMRSPEDLSTRSADPGIGGQKQCQQKFTNFVSKN